jgi:5-methylcytosine-specific restriction endonuclease McrA
MDSRRRRKHREALWRKDPRCFWCGKLTVLTEAKQRNAATIDHLYSRLHPKRENNGLINTVLACRACNIQRADYESKGAYFMPKLKERIDIARATCAVTAQRSNKENKDA